MAETQRSAHFKAVIEQCLREGFEPFRTHIAGSRGSAVREAARRLGVDPTTLTSWTDRQIRCNAAGEPNCLPDWSLFNGDWASPPPAADYVQVVNEAPPADPIELRRLRDENAALRSALKESERRTADAEDIRAGILGITQTPMRPRLSIPGLLPDADRARQSVVLHISDVHAGEVIKSKELLGSNRYDLPTCRARMGRLFDTCADLCTRHWPREDNPADELVVCLGGDLVSGSIHPELAETNDGTDYQIFREVSELVAGGIELLRTRTGLPMRVFSVPGNHGRQVLKPQMKRQGLMSWDTMVADFVEAAMRHDDGIEWFRSEGTDCYFDVNGWPILLTHGHSMGTGGGQGFAGPMLPIVRGHRKVADTETRQRRPVYMVLSGHYHTTGITPFGAANGSIVGYGEFARHIRADPEPAKQNMLVFHERRGLIRWHPIYVGAPEEGTLYQGFGGWNAPMLDGGDM